MDGVVRRRKANPKDSPAGPAPSRAVRLQLETLRAYDRFRLRRLMARHRGLEIHPTASSNLAAARYELAEGARLRIAAGVVTERLAEARARRHAAIAADGVADLDDEDEDDEDDA